MAIARHALEKLSRGRVIKRSLPKALGGAPIFVSPDAMLSFWKPGLRSDLFEVVQELVKPSAVVWDVGANVGLFAFAAAYCAGESGSVVAFEPDAWLGSLIRRSARFRARRSSVELIPAAISDRVAIQQFEIAQGARATSHLAGYKGSLHAGGVRETTSVLTVTLDWVAAQRPAPHVLKIDVEGAELDVLRGGTRLLTELRPAVFCEVWKESAEAVTQLLHSHNYELFDWPNRQSGPVDLATWNTLALPR